MLTKPTPFAVRRSVGVASVIMAVWAAGAVAAAAGGPTPVSPVSNACQRFNAGSVIHNPPALFSSNGVLNVQFSYQTTTDSVGRQRYCFMTPSGLENPTLHVNAGDTLNITVTNNTPPVNLNAPNTSSEVFNPPTCGDTTSNELVNLDNTVPVPSPPAPTPTATSFNVTSGSMNIHYHGTNTSPQCGGDNVVKTLVNAGETFSYSLVFPTNEPPGLYWYHPHVHGLAETAVQGGASGALIVEGINNVQPAAAGMRHRIIMIRDQQTLQQLTESAGGQEGGIPQVDLTVDNVPLNTTVNTSVNPPTVSYTPAVLHMFSGETQLWRVSNSTSDVILNLQYRFNGTPQTIQIVGIDAVPVNSQDGTQPGSLIPVTEFRLPPASRVEFLATAPTSSSTVAQLFTQNIISGPLGDDSPTRPLITVSLVGSPDSDEPVTDDSVPAYTALDTSKQRFGGIMSVTPAVSRTVYFEELEDGTEFFINASGCVTAAGAQCNTQVQNGVQIDTAFDNNLPPAIITTQGTVEQWTIQNHARENHELHQHQIHFKVLSQNNFEVNGQFEADGVTKRSAAPGINGQFLDMVEVPFCGGDPAGPPTFPEPAATNPPNPPACITANNGGPPLPYPSVVALMDFRGPDTGDFVFHCHILGHEDRGMMQIERVVAPSN
jgi:FtsP/CotA-like multicopper oxidase with cupredoxin domain